MLERKDPTYVKDRMGNFMAGVTGQIKLTNRIALTGDFPIILNAAQMPHLMARAFVLQEGFKEF
jgi:OOP family OmpA-OmpF porin